MADVFGVWVCFFFFKKSFLDKHAFIYLLLNNVSHLVCVFSVLGTSDTELI